MQHTKGKDVLLRLKRAWIYQRLLVALLIAGAICIAATTLFSRLFQVPFFYGIPLLVLIFVGFSILNRWWKLSEWDVARFLNQHEPKLEESTELVLQPPHTLNLLQKLQLQKVEYELARLQPPHPLKKKTGVAMLVLVLIGVIAVFIAYLPINWLLPQSDAYNSLSVNTEKQVLPPEVKDLKLTIIPPAYTRLAAKTQNKFDVQVEEGSTVVWRVETTVAAKSLQLIFNDGTHLNLSGNSTSENIYQAQKVIIKPGFYQLKTGDKLSELYKIEVVKDKVPVIAIQTPKPATTVGFGQSRNVLLRASVTDDYGIRSASISATVSSGEGEAVKFKQHTLLFDNFVAGQRQNVLQKSLDLKALGMEPGNELYFFITAADNHNQEVRSDVYLVTLEDTTVESSMDGMVNGLDVKPDLFRSERQIIIESEQLLQDRGKISVEAFQKKSEDLGVDQKLLRLRYGKFLGEETDTEIGAHEEPGDQDKKSITDGASEILEQYGHAHDNAEDATFFDPATKKQLKETLAEMWKAELQLRTFKPKEALVFEYKALRLLKDLQQKSRAYVAKTGFTATPLKMEKRLTGDLSKISQPVMQQQFDKIIPPELVVRKAIGELEILKQKGFLSTSSKEIVQQAFQQLSTKAAQVPSLYLPALSALRKVLSNTCGAADIYKAETGLQQMLPVPVSLPSPANKMTEHNLSGRYFTNLNGGSRQ